MKEKDYLKFRNSFSKLIHEKKFLELKEEIMKLNVVDIAEIIEDMNDTDMIFSFRILPKEKAAQVFSFMGKSKQVSIAKSINEKELNELIDEMSFDDRIDLFEEAPANFVKKLILNAPAEERDLINKFLNYPEDSAGSIMTIEYLKLKSIMTVEESLNYIRKAGLDRETIYTCYVEDDHKKLIGFVSLKNLVLSKGNKLIEDIMNKNIISVNTLDDQEEVADKFIKYGLIAMPVVDGENRLCGIITFDDIMDIVEEEATEDFHRMAAINPSDDEYLDQSIFALSKNRIPWLLVLMISATLTSGIIDRYDNIIAHYIILSSFIPMLTDTGGNSGAQSSTVVIRALATGQIDLSDFLKVVVKEVGVGLICGSILAVVNFFRMVYIAKVEIKISILVSLTILSGVIISKLLGAILPMVAKKFNIDPAVMASALITTIVDSTVLIIYFVLASKFLNII
ncbi:MAG: magnesium transporter [Peptoniphilaceae bacterium]